MVQIYWLLLHCKNELGEQFLQNSALHTSWYLAFRCFVFKQREFKRNKNSLAFIQSAESKHIRISANSSATINGITSKELEYHQTCAMMVETEDSVLPSDFVITPTIITYNYGNCHRLNCDYSLSGVMGSVLMCIFSVD